MGCAAGGGLIVWRRSTTSCKRCWRQRIFGICSERALLIEEVKCFRDCVWAGCGCRACFAFLLPSRNSFHSARVSQTLFCLGCTEVLDVLHSHFILTCRSSQMLLCAKVCGSTVKLHCNLFHSAVSRIYLRELNVIS